MTESFSGLAVEYPAPDINCLALSTFGLSYPEADRAALSKYLSKVGLTTPVWLAAGCWPPSPISATWLRSMASAIACRTASLLVSGCEGSRLGTRLTLVTGGDQVLLSLDLLR